MPLKPQVTRSTATTKTVTTPKQKQKASSRTQTPEQAEQKETNGITVISTAGDLILVIDHGADQDKSNARSNKMGDNEVICCRYRVDSTTLKDASPYFGRLLDPEKFGEGSYVAERHAVLRTFTRSMTDIPMEDLPQVKLSDVGRISSVKSIRLLMADFLNMLHNADLSNPNPPIANLANLAIVADRFDALAVTKRYVESKRLMQMLDSKAQDRTAKATAEEKVRQRLLVGLLFDNPSWVWHSSSKLIQRGWVGHEITDDSPLWWDLPMGIEEELLFRRECVLETIQSVQSHFLTLYTSRDRQCKLGYDSSAECDSYQLGQMIRFFKRVGTLDLAGLLLPAAYTDEALPDPYDGDIADLLDTLRQCPEYQIDKNHSHCGLRTRLMPILELIETSLLGETGICTLCWQACRHDYAWSKVKRPLIWKAGGGVAGWQQYKARQAQNHLYKHMDVRDMFMAKERLWTS